jgi:hypothetical protein
LKSIRRNKKTGTKKKERTWMPRGGTRKRKPKRKTKRKTRKKTKKRKSHKRKTRRKKTHTKSLK